MGVHFAWKQRQIYYREREQVRDRKIKREKEEGKETVCELVCLFSERRMNIKTATRTTATKI